jgi:hypothetical protein
VDGGSTSDVPAEEKKTEIADEETKTAAEETKLSD